MDESGYAIIDDNTDPSEYINPVVDGEVKLCSCFGMQAPGLNGLKGPLFEDQDKVKLIPRNEWDDRIQEIEDNNATLQQLAEARGLEVLDQNGTNFCWFNGPTFGAMLARLKETSQEVRLSPASGAAPIKNFSNRGGWGSEALDWLIEKGVNLASDWPPNAIDRRYYTEENRQKALRNRVTEYFRCRTWDEVGSTILSGIGVGVGFNHWSHLVCGVHLTRGEHNLVFANSWGPNYGNNGYGILKGSKKYPDGESVAITSMTAI